MGVKATVEGRVGDRLSWTDVIGRSLGAALYSAGAWVARTSLVVLTLKFWGVL